MKKELDDKIIVTIYDGKRDFFFNVMCDDLNDLLDISERFPRNVYQFGSLELVRSDRFE